MESPLRPAEEPSATDVENATRGGISRLRERGIDVSDGTSAEVVVDLLDAVETFEAAAAARGCDTFTNTLESSQPDDDACVLPRLRDDESIADYTRRVRTATEQITTR